jgi:hypothetical protein
MGFWGIRLGSGLGDKKSPHCWGRREGSLASGYFRDLVCFALVLLFAFKVLVPRGGRVHFRVPFFFARLRMLLLKYPKFLQQLQHPSAWELWMWEISESQA